jgi:glucosamine-6-phosphate deaminase
MTKTTPLTNFTADKLQVKMYETRTAMGFEAAKEVAEKIRELLSIRQGSVNIIFAAAPSQAELLFFLLQEDNIDWSRVNGFHMDEYVGISQDAPQSFACFLKTNLFSKVAFNVVH